MKNNKDEKTEKSLAEIQEELIKIKEKLDSDPEFRRRVLELGEQYQKRYSILAAEDLNKLIGKKDKGMTTVRGVVLEYHATKDGKRYRIYIWDSNWSEIVYPCYWIYGIGNKPSFVKKGVEIIAEITDDYNIKSIKIGDEEG